MYFSQSYSDNTCNVIIGEYNIELSLVLTTSAMDCSRGKLSSPGRISDGELELLLSGGEYYAIQTQ